jgi:type I site-specific restriction endonuclease
MDSTQTEEITIEKLAVMINNGFKEAHKDLIDVTSRLEEKLSGRMDSLEQRMDNFEKKMDYRFDGLQNQLDNIYLNYTQRHEHNLLKERVRKVERKVGIMPVR